MKQIADDSLASTYLQFLFKHFHVFWTVNINILHTKLNVIITRKWTPVTGLVKLYHFSLVIDEQTPV